MECNAFSRRPSRNASPFQFVGGARSRSPRGRRSRGEGRAVGERERDLARRFRLERNEKRKTESSRERVHLVRFIRWMGEEEEEEEGRDASRGCLT